jgi:acetolactate synthase-1/2/3 large subunit
MDSGILSILTKNNSAEHTVAKWLTLFLEAQGIRHSFSVTGGAAMHLNNAFGESTKIVTTYLHNEQSCAMAAEALARIESIPSCVVVTAGPGVLNALNGVFGAFTDSIPMIVISGQARSDTLISSTGIKNLRQFGDQELDVITTVSRITKWCMQMRNPLELPEILAEAYKVATTGRPGPVWIDIPVDIQGVKVTGKDFIRKSENRKVIEPEVSENQLLSFFNKLSASHRPLILAGTGVSIEKQKTQLLALSRKLNIPIATAWCHDLIDSDDPLFAGRPGTIGTRSGNFILQTSDFLLILGSRLNVRQTGYNWESFAPYAHKVWVDIDPSELAKPVPKVDEIIHSSIKYFIERAQTYPVNLPIWDNWINWCQTIQKEFKPKASDYKIEFGRINAYHVIPAIFSKLRDDDIVVCGDATACIVPFQTGQIKGSMRMFSNSGCASMGYDLPAALGASLNSKKSRVICFAGDGSIMMNIQELQSLYSLNANVILFILENDGYLSIKQTQKNFFGKQYGSDKLSGVSFPNFEDVCNAFKIQTFQLDPKNWEKEIGSILEKDGPLAVVVPLAINQEFEPRLKSKKTDKGITTPSLDDMFPHLDSRILEDIRRKGREID